MIFFIQTYAFYTSKFNRLSTPSETEEGEKINKTKSYQETLSAPFSPWVFTMIGQSCRDVPLLEAPPFLLKEPPCQRIKMLFSCQNL